MASAGVSPASRFRTPPSIGNVLEGVKQSDPQDQKFPEEPCRARVLGSEDI